jgi:hypothetical protein
MGDALTHHASRKCPSRQALYLILFFLLNVLLFAIPVVADFGNKLQAMAPRTGMLIPLYIYPVPGAWDPLYAA